MTDTPNPQPAPPGDATSRDLRRLRTRIVAAAGGAGLAIVGGALLAHAQRHAPPSAMLAPTSVATLRGSDDIAIKGDVAEIFGNHFILRDATGRALVDTGPRGEGDGDLVAKGETLQAQGRFEHGALHAVMLVHADGRRVDLGPPAPRPPRADIAVLTERMRSAGYDDIHVVGGGPRHLDVVARAPDGTERDLHVDIDGSIRERGAP